MQTITIEQAIVRERCLFVDTRSPSEYEQGHIPGAVNVPLLEDDERAIVGTLYKQCGQELAKQKGLELVSGKLADMVKTIATLKTAAPAAVLIVYCWRGGMRSKSVLTILELMGITGFQLVGGYKSYRRYVQEQLANFDLRPTIVVLCGSTGVGKTTLLQLLSARQVPVIDLEKLANHRGSAFGQVGLGKPATAQNFDAQLLLLLNQFNDEPFLVVECESKRVGNVYLPDRLCVAMQTGRKILVRAGVDTRVRRLIDEYTDVLQFQDPEVLKSITALTKRLGKKKIAELIQKYQAGELPEFTRTLLVDYYDPLYGYETASQEKFDLAVDAEELESAALEIAQYIDRLMRG
jgi:tRNA 2-selenouridine synthase